MHAPADDHHVIRVFQFMLAPHAFERLFLLLPM
jgi:hypothetical protein